MYQSTGSIASTLISSLYLSLVLVPVPTFSALSPDPPVVQLGSKTHITGISFPTLGQEAFLGIPFAEAPVGPLRFAPPVLKTSLDSNSNDSAPTFFNATSFGPSCPFFGATPIDTVSEDCLSVNIFRPAGLNVTSGLPIQVYAYGSGFTAGESITFNASAVIGQSIQRGTPMIFVTFNYRVGPLGYPQGTEAIQEGALNLGIKDVEAVLQWVQVNIAAFGGSPEKVTISGASAGSINLSALMLNPDFKLARAAIVESGFADTLPLFDASHHESIWEAFAAAVPTCVPSTNSSNTTSSSNNGTFDCLRQASLEEIVEAGNELLANSASAFPFLPVLDGAGGLIPDLPSTLYSQGHFAHIPIITGQNTDEGTSFVPLEITNNTELGEALFAAFDPSPSLPSSGPTASSSDITAALATLLALYPDNPSLGAPFGTGNATFGLSPTFKRAAAIEGDLGFHGSRRALSGVFAQNKVPVFAYLFSEPQPQLPPFMGVTHGTEVPFLFGDVSAAANGTAKVILSNTMIDYWVSFVTSLDPNDNHGNISLLTLFGKIGPVWSQYTMKTQDLIQLNSADMSPVADNYRAEQISFINNDTLVFRR